MASGSTIDSCTNMLDRLARPLASAGSLSRSGPTLPLAPAAASVWQLAQPFFAKTDLPPPRRRPKAAAVRRRLEARRGARGGSAAALRLPRPVAKSPRVRTIAERRISAWPSPQSSVQITG